jgi:diphosphoinositol-polyphosphate diphosphatase
MAVLVARQGRELQRYSKNTGGRIVVGCIPYRVRCDGELEVLVITSQKGHGMMFPKGGWEEDESMDEAARREALEEAGVLGDTEQVLGFWHYKSRGYVDQTKEGFMFPLRVADVLHQWPEMASRKRTWVSPEFATTTVPVTFPCQFDRGDINTYCDNEHVCRLTTRSLFD